MIKLPRLPPNYEKQPQLFERYWNEAMSQIEANVNEILSLPAIQAAITALNAATAAANTAATNAQTTANNVQAQADAQALENSLINSYVDPSSFTAPLLTATSTGSITVKNHSRIYGDPALNPTVSVTGGTFASGGASGDTVRVYYDDTTRAGGAVTYYVAIDPAANAQSGNTHSVGAVTIPAAGTADGKFLLPPGGFYF